jgi:SAM-dependent methyltransferase
VDIFITQDVLEHVFHPERAIAEIHRVLKPGGAHVFTAPKHKGLAETVQRAAIDATGEVQYLLPAEYHGNPIGDNKALVTYDYGHDFERLLSIWSGTTVRVFHTVDRGRGIDAEFNEVFVIAKQGARHENEAPATRQPFAGPGDFARRAVRKAGRVARERLGSARG